MMTFAVGSLKLCKPQSDSGPNSSSECFQTTIVLRTNASGDPTFNEILRRVRKVTLEAYRNQDIPIEEILRVLQVPRSLDRHPLFQIMFILQAASPAPTLPALSSQFLEIDPGVARFDLTLELTETEKTLTGFFEYSTDLFDRATAVRMATHFYAFFWRQLLPIPRNGSLAIRYFLRRNDVAS